jgi:DNA-binding transcriptional MerR regulator
MPFYYPPLRKFAMGEPTFTITDLSREFQVTPRAIRHYEAQGLIFPERSGQQRIYSKRDRTRLKLTLRGKRLGLSLVEIKELIDMYDTAPDESSQLVKVLAVLAKRRQALMQQREDIEAVLGELDSFEHQCRDILDAAGGRAPRGRA